MFQNTFGFSFNLPFLRGFHACKVSALQIGVVSTIQHFSTSVFIVETEGVYSVSEIDPRF